MRTKTVKISVTDLEGILLDSIIMVIINPETTDLAIHQMKPGEHTNDEVLVIGKEFLA